MASVAVLRGALVVAAWLLAAPVPAVGQATAGRDHAAAEDALRAGDYEAAASLFEQALGGDPAHRVAAAAGLARARRAVGDYDAGLEALAGLESQPAVAALRADLLRRRGRVEEATAELVALEAAGRLSPQATLILGELFWEQGRASEAVERFDALIDVYNRSSALSAGELAAVARACRHLGREDPALFKDALKAYDEAIARDPGFLEARVELAELFVEKYNGPEAATELTAVLEHNPHHAAGRVAAARLLHFQGAHGALEEVRKALETNPRFAPARAFAAELLLELEKYGEAAGEAQLALTTNERSLPALSALAAARYFQRDTREFERLRDRVLELNPRYADFFVLMAEACARNRLYREAAEFAARGTELDDKSWAAFTQLGLNELRIGEIEVGTAHLAQAFAGDPYNVWTKNTLDLVDTFPEFGTATSERFVAMARREEADLILPYALRLAEEAYDELAARYRVRPATPIRLELYPSSADFSVRTVGLAGMGALGVCFGPVIAQDSPAARRGGYNWGSTLWHELAHTFTLAASGHHVPRWLTEGLSVLEERRARSGWGDDLSMQFLLAWRDDELLPIADLNEGFVRPESPEQIGLSYYQASLVVEQIEEQHGFDAVLGLLAGYRDGKPTKEIFRDVLDLALPAYDEAFMAFLDRRFGAQLAAIEDFDPQRPRAELDDLAAAAAQSPEDFQTQFSYGSALLGEGRGEEAEPFLRRARDLLPQFAAEGSPYHLLVQIYLDEGRSDEARGALESLLRYNENDYEAHRQLADLQRQGGDLKAAAETLERAMYIFPYDSEAHETLAAIYSEADDSGGLVRARRSLLALRPVDRATAHLRLAEALLADHETSAARREVLQALELAPSFAEAQRLLLELRGGAAGAAKAGDS